MKKPTLLLYLLLAACSDPRSSPLDGYNARYKEILHAIFDCHAQYADTLYGTDFTGIDIIQGAMTFCNRPLKDYEELTVLVHKEHYGADEATARQSTLPWINQVRGTGLLIVQNRLQRLKEGRVLLGDKDPCLSHSSSEPFIRNP